MSNPTSSAAKADDDTEEAIVVATKQLGHQQKIQAKRQPGDHQPINQPINRPTTQPTNQPSARKHTIGVGVACATHAQTQSHLLFRVHIYGASTVHWFDVGVDCRQESNSCEVFEAALGQVAVTTSSAATTTKRVVTVTVTATSTIAEPECLSVCFTSLPNLHETTHEQKNIREERMHAPKHSIHGVIGGGSQQDSRRQAVRCHDAAQQLQHERQRERLSSSKRAVHQLHGPRLMCDMGPHSCVDRESVLRWEQPVGGVQETLLLGAVQVVLVAQRHGSSLHVRGKRRRGGVRSSNRAPERLRRANDAGYERAIRLVMVQSELLLRHKAFVPRQHVDLERQVAHPNGIDWRALAPAKAPAVGIVEKGNLQTVPCQPDTHAQPKSVLVAYRRRLQVAERSSRS